MSDALMLSWVKGASAVAPPPPVDIPPPDLALLPPSEPGIVLPAVEAAAQDLAHRQVMGEFRFRQLDQDAKRGAFTVARIASEDTLAKIQEAMTEDVRDGGTLTQFVERVEQALGSSLLSPRHLETVYRTNTAQAMTAGMMEVLAHPLVEDEFPYLRYDAIHDVRARPDHLEMEQRGLNGTNVYRRDDPIWRLFLPPWDFNCRCSVTPLTLEDAAAAGVREAREWLETGEPPTQPEYVGDPPFRPSPHWLGARGSNPVGGIV